jgi:hypothetical protein
MFSMRHGSSAIAKPEAKRPHRRASVHGRKTLPQRVLGDHAREDKLKKIVWSPRFRPHPAVPSSPEGLPPDQGPR